MSKQFQFKDEHTRSYGRNGLYKTIGVYIGTTYSIRNENVGLDGRAISITGVNSRNLPASGDLNVPISDIPELIEMLKTFIP